MVTEAAKYSACYESPLGLIRVTGTETAVCAIEFIDEPPAQQVSNPTIEEAVRQLEQYFRKEQRTFDIPIAPHGTEFQKTVWDKLVTISYGQVVSYMDIANALEKPKAVRAVGAANGRNPIAIVVPCHRIIGSNGKLTGYAGGLWRKEWLLRHEGSLLV